jgi:hypothetical protein
MKKYMIVLSIFWLIGRWLFLYIICSGTDTQESKEYNTIKFCEDKWYNWKYEMWQRELTWLYLWVSETYKYIVCDWENPISTWTINKEIFKNMLWKNCNHILSPVILDNREIPENVIDFISSEYFIDDMAWIYDCSKLRN